MAKNRSIVVYDLVGIDDRRMSPFCWRAKLALAHKELAFETTAVRFTDKDKLVFSGQDKVPVIVDGNTTVYDSWTIACYLEDRYPERPSLFSGEANRRLARIFNHWFDEQVTMKLFPLMVPDNFDVVCPEDLAYYTRSRFAWLGKTREELAAERSEEDFVAWRRTLEPIREQLKMNDFIGGNTPLYPDYISFSVFMWARAVSPWPVILPDDPVYVWRERMLDLFDGLAGTSPGYRY